MPQNLLILLAAALTGGLALASLCGTRSRARWVQVAGATAGLFLLFGGVGDSLWIGGLLLLLAGVLFVCDWKEVRGLRTIVCAAAVPVIVVVMVGVSRMQKVRRIDSLRAEYPFVSLRDRLPAGTVTLSQDEINRARSDDFDDMTSEGARAQQLAGMRSAALEQMHSGFQREFAAAPGFGVIRMRRVPYEWAVLPEINPPAPLPVPPESSNSSGDTGATTASRVPDPAFVEDLHRRVRGSFLSAESFGYVRDMDHVAGFVPHAFRRRFDPVAGPNVGDVSPSPDAVAWKATSLRLVSLLRFETPRVYETEDFPDMSRMKDVPTRPLDNFERVALAELNTREIVTEVEPNRIHMLGALRASGNCIECHQVRRGTLLGAFRYVLSRFPPIPEAKLTL